MLKRTITGFFILVILAGFVALREVSVLFFDGLVLALLYGSIIEMCKAKKLFEKKFFVSVLLMYPVPLACIYIFSTTVMQCILLQILLGLLVFALCMFAELVLSGAKNSEPEKQEQSNNLLAGTVSVLSLVLYPTTFVGTLFGINHIGMNIGYIGIILVFAISMCTDTFAYLFGSLIKGPRLAPEISPKKSISGFLFGALGGVVAAGLCLYLFHFAGLLPSAIVGMSDLNAVLLFVTIGLLGTFLTQFGDLVASAIKRKTGIKDFGSIFPGHGGFMDRIDGAMFNSLLVFVVFALFLC